MTKKIKISIDRGGTFTDIIAEIPGREPVNFKLLSVDPSNYDDAPVEGIARVIQMFNDGKPFKRGEKIRLDTIESIRMGTTVATNALLERKGAKTVLLTTKGFRDVLAIGNQARPDIFDLSSMRLQQLYSKVVEIDERVTIEGYSEDGPKPPINYDDPQIVSGSTKDPIRIITKPKPDEIKAQLQEIWNEGYRSIAVCLLHSYSYPNHEELVASMAREFGFQVSVSVELQPMIGFVGRTSSTVADAYLLPVIHDYLDGFVSGFEGGAEALKDKLLFMQSDGGLCNSDQFTGLHAILSGPAGGIVGYSKTCFENFSDKATLGFDMGGTSTDVSRYDGKFEHIFDNVIDQIALNTPQLDINTIAAGGGSILFWKNGMFVVGPESAGAHPGPACYRKGGPLTVTDANLFLGRLIPESFPCIFGPNEDEPLDKDIVVTKFNRITEEINRESANNFTPEEVANGFLTVANEAMTRPIRNLTEGKGYPTKDHNLAAFGGAGGQHAVAIARNLDIEKVAVHKYSSLLSAYGIALADITLDKLKPLGVVFEEESINYIQGTIEQLTEATLTEFRGHGYSDSIEVEVEIYLNMKYVGSDTHLMMLKPADTWDFKTPFIAKHQLEFGFTLEREVMVDDCRVRLVSKSVKVKEIDPFKEFNALSFSKIDESRSLLARQTYFQETGWIACNVYDIGNIPLGSYIEGPAIVIDKTQTILIEPKSRANMLANHILITVASKEKSQINPDIIDPIQLSVFGHRFMSIAEQMGRTLQLTAISTNIKERLDFSCALFDKKGDLVANAPHMPSHLGAMSYSVKAQIDIWKGDIHKGDVIVSNHPVAGGSHLPDLTVITPVLDDNEEVLFWTASRGHHADIGGIAAGSMPPFSKEIWQEGTSIISHKLCSKGVFDEEGITDLLLVQPAKYPQCSGTRTLNDNISDLKAQIAANHKGCELIIALIEEYTFKVIQRYMIGIQETAELAVRNLLKFVFKRFGSKVLHGRDYLDDGTPIDLKVTIDGDKGSALFDFTDTGDQVYGNLNTPKAILYSGVIYVLRCLVSADIPLNQGCLIPIDIRVREGSLFSPSPECATVGGNVETIQRIVDVLLRAFRASAGAQGTCNNFTFGVGETDENMQFHGFGYYETIAGGSGAGPNWEGQNAVQCHTTNTRMTDVEVFEKRYPVLLEAYKIRDGSGGKGIHNGGDGLTRRIKFLIDLEVSVLSERRAFAPFGMAGGEDGERGFNYYFKLQPDGNYIRYSLGGKNTVNVKAGDIVEINTPSGGGYGDLEAGLSEADIQYITSRVSNPLKTGTLAKQDIISTTN